jgi:hypothetical protein
VRPEGPGSHRANPRQTPLTFARRGSVGLGADCARGRCESGWERGAGLDVELVEHVVRWSSTVRAVTNRVWAIQNVWIDHEKTFYLPPTQPKRSRSCSQIVRAC